MHYRSWTHILPVHTFTLKNTSARHCSMQPQYNCVHLEWMSTGLCPMGRMRAKRRPHTQTHTHTHANAEYQRTRHPPTRTFHFLGNLLQWKLKWNNYQSGLSKYKIVLNTKKKKKYKKSRRLKQSYTDSLLLSTTLAFWEFHSQSQNLMHVPVSVTHSAATLASATSLVPAPVFLSPSDRGKRQ